MFRLLRVTPKLLTAPVAVVPRTVAASLSVALPCALHTEAPNVASICRRWLTTPATSAAVGAANIVRPTLVEDTAPRAAVEEAPLKEIFAVVHIAGHQYKVSPGDVLVCQRIEGQVGETIRLDKVLMVGDATFTKIGLPLVANSYVVAVIEEQTLANKIIVFKKRRRKGYERTRGHRQRVTTLRITDVEFAQE